MKGRKRLFLRYFAKYSNNFFKYGPISPAIVLFYLHKVMRSRISPQTANMIIIGEVSGPKDSTGFDLFCADFVPMSNNHSWSEVGQRSVIRVVLGLVIPNICSDLEKSYF